MSKLDPIRERRIQRDVPRRAHLPVSTGLDANDDSVKANLYNFLLTIVLNKSFSLKDKQVNERFL